MFDYFRTKDEWQIPTDLFGPAGPVSAVVDLGGWKRWYGVELGATSGPLFFLYYTDPNDHAKRYLILFSIVDILGILKSEIYVEITMVWPQENFEVSKVTAISKDVIESSLVFIFTREGRQDYIIDTTGATEEQMVTERQQIWPGG